MFLPLTPEARAQGPLPCTDLEAWAPQPAKTTARGLAPGRATRHRATQRQPHLIPSARDCEGRS